MKKPILALVCFVTPLVQAQEMESVLVTGTHSPIAELTASISVLNQEQIRLLNRRSLGELLQTVPGLLVDQQGGPGSPTAVSIRGAEANFTLVLLDGVPVNDPTNIRGGGYDFANLNPALVERIEIVRGAQSAIYGSDALAGVINIVTRPPDPGHDVELSAEWGQDDFANYTVGARGNSGSWDYSVGYAYRDDGDSVQGSARETDNANLRLGWNLIEGQRLELSYRYTDGERSSYPEQSGGPELAVSEALDTSDYRDEVFAFSWQARFSDRWVSRLAADRFSHEDDYRSPGIAPYFEVPPNGAESEFERDQLHWVNTLTFSDDTEFTLGGDYRDEKGESVGYVEYFGSQLPTGYKMERSTTGVFANASISPLDALLVQASVRYDDPDSADSETTYSLGGRYALGQAVSLSANWGEAFKLPSFAALGHPLVGNPDLEPELATNWDLGIAWAINDRLALTATGFFNDYKDLVDFDNETFRNVNRSNVETSGVEFEGKWQANDALHLSGQATYTDIDVKGEDTVLTGRPEWVASLSASWQIATRWQTALDYRYIGEQWAASRHSGMEENRQLDDFHRLDWTLRFLPAHYWQLQFSADNLLDENYQTAIGFPAPGRGFRLGIRYGPS